MITKITVGTGAAPVWTAGSTYTWTFFKAIPQALRISRFCIPGFNQLQQKTVILIRRWESADA